MIVYIYICILCVYIYIFLIYICIYIYIYIHIINIQLYLHVYIYIYQIFRHVTDFHYVGIVLCVKPSDLLPATLPLISCIVSLAPLAACQAHRSEALRLKRELAVLQALDIEDDIRSITKVSDYIEVK